MELLTAAPLLRGFADRGHIGLVSSSGIRSRLLLATLPGAVAGDLAREANWFPVGRPIR